MSWIRKALKWGLILVFTLATILAVTFAYFETIGTPSSAKESIERFYKSIDVGIALWEVDEKVSEEIQTLRASAMSFSLIIETACYGRESLSKAYSRIELLESKHAGDVFLYCSKRKNHETRSTTYFQNTHLVAVFLSGEGGLSRRTVSVSMIDAEGNIVKQK